MNLRNFTNDGRKIIAQMGCFSVLEHIKDLSVSPYNSATEYFMEKMGVRRRQVVAQLNNSSITMQAGALQWMSGNIQMDSNVKGVGDFLGKAIKGAVTKESAAKPIYSGSGLIVLEPTYKYLILMDVSQWGPAGVTIEDGMYLANDAGVGIQVVARKNMSSAVLGGEGLFNVNLVGKGVAVLESNVPQEELVEIDLNNEVLKIDGNQAVCWSNSLEFTVEKSTKSLIGSAVSNEGFLNVYRGTGRVWLSPVSPTSSLASATNTTSAKAAAPNSNAFNAAGGLIGGIISGMQ